MQGWIARFFFLCLGSVLPLTSFGSVVCAGNYSSTSIEKENMEQVELLISHEEIKSKVADVADAIDAQYQGEELVIVMVMKGALCIAADLIRELKTPCTIECIRASSYGQHGTMRGELTVFGLEDLDLSSKNVLVVDDIFDTGKTLLHVVTKIREKNPKSLRSLVLLKKNVKRDVAYHPDYILFNIENLFVVGYGLDHKEYYRGLPGVYIFK